MLLKGAELPLRLTVLPPAGMKRVRAAAQAAAQAMAKAQAGANGPPPPRSKMPRWKTWGKKDAAAATAPAGGETGPVAPAWLVGQHECVSQCSHCP